MDASHDEHSSASYDPFIYVAIFILVTWPATLLLGLLDTLLIDNPDDYLNLFTPVAGAVVGGLVVLTIVAVRNYRRHRAATANESKPEISWSEATRPVLCPNCGYEGSPLSDRRGKKLCPWCDHRIAQGIMGLDPELTVSSGAKDRPGEPSQGTWYFSRDGQEREPTTFSKLKRLVDLGRMSRSAKVWREGMPHWMMIGELPGLFGEPQNGSDHTGHAETNGYSSKPSEERSSNGVAQLTSPVKSRRLSNEDEWYYISGDNAEPHGPISFAELRRRAARHELFPTDLVLGPGSEWTEARFVASLFRESRKK